MFKKIVESAQIAVVTPRRTANRKVFKDIAV